ncbi:DUF7692 domain-containing protein [Halovenus sp. HT40]|uniref:DUF7692 domain-containing protein n=1 Tax=Halovenus sp. HT40 TaxID=3126691 RepID=UPI003FA5BCB1
MRINTSGKKEWRTDLYERTANTLNESPKTGAIDSACIHTIRNLKLNRGQLNISVVGSRRKKSNKLPIFLALM